jgi:ferredoxin-NADP reductase
VDVRGVRHWRAYSLTSEPYRQDGLISITPKVVDAGVVSPYLVRHGRPGTIVSLGGVEGEFVLGDPPPERILFITAGSGITPVMSMLRRLDSEQRLRDVVMLHSERSLDEVIFGSELRALAQRHEGLKLHEQSTSTSGRLRPDDLDQLAADWREREAFISGPGEMLDAFASRWDRDGDCDRLHMERFQPRLGLGSNGAGDGGSIRFLASGAEAESDGHAPILVAGEQAGLELPYGCREGICHTCVGELRAGRVRDLRTGQVFGASGEVIRTCVSAPEGPIEIDL